MQRGFTRDITATELSASRLRMRLKRCSQRRPRKGVSQVYLADLRYRLGNFAKAFVCDVSALGPDDVALFFEHLQLSAGSHNNYMSTLRTFLAFAQRHGWLSKEVDLLSHVEKRSGKRAPVEIFTPNELATILKHAPPLRHASR